MERCRTRGLVAGKCWGLLGWFQVVGWYCIIFKLEKRVKWNIRDSGYQVLLRLFL